MCAEPQDFDPQIMNKVRLPMVVIDWWLQPLNADIIHENSEFGGYLATKALIERIQHSDLNLENIQLMPELVIRASF